MAIENSLIIPSNSKLWNLGISLFEKRVESLDEFKGLDLKVKIFSNTYDLSIRGLGYILNIRNEFYQNFDNEFGRYIKERAEKKKE